MTDSSHIYHPQSDSLEDRIAAFRAVYRAYQNAEASLSLIDDPAWTDRLGNREDVQAGLTISKHSLALATQAISKEEAQQAEQQGLMQSEDMTVLMRSLRQQEAASVRLNQQSHESQQHQSR